MFDDLHEIAENSAYLKAVEEKDVSTEIVEKLPRYEELGEWEAKLKREGALTFASIFHRPAGFHLFLTFLKGHFSDDKGYFVRDVEAFQKMRFDSARRKVASALYERYVRPRRDESMEALPDGDPDATAVPSEWAPPGAVEGSHAPAPGLAPPPTPIGLNAQANVTGSLFEALPAATMRPEESDTNGVAAPAPVQPAARPPPAGPRHSTASASGVDSLSVRSESSGSRSGTRRGTRGLGSMLNVGLTNPIGVFGAPVRRVKEAIEAGRSDATLFDGVLAAVLSDLQHDLFPRFVKSEQYRQYVRATAATQRPVSLRDFQTFRVLGRGGFGTVHACRKADSGAMYAMKMINKRLCVKKKATHHIMGEREVLKMVRGRHVTNLKYALQDKDNLVLVMDLCMGGDLKFHLARHGRFSPERARFYAAEVLLGLDQLHGLNIAYRDLKLENVLLDDTGHVRLSDLGLAVVARGGPGVASVTGYAGTPGYAAPEVVRREPYGLSADLFSYGVLIYRMVSGSKPFKERDGETRDAAVLRDDPPFPPGVFDADAADLVRGLIEKDASKRLGAGPGGLERIKEHPYFRSIDWGLLEAGYVEPPFVPNRYDVNAASLRDIGDFDDDSLRNVELDDAFLEAASKFDYVSDEALQEEIAAALQKDEEARIAAEAGRGVPKQSKAAGCCAVM